ncbi:MAG: cupin domain-containing protein [Rhodococcus sp. (in: high G+C Gram-positive bacteria)]|uniref:cupin domain-containing protein n=1 Tax=Rhodococcus sp. TaxID=1831 RepID=UPI002AD7D95D|nr:cupin domain-containing protein [Rhodococcus sp. (in: high G+C Gram-positive bacteria)]
MSKPRLEFHQPEDRRHRPPGSAEGIWQQDLSRDPDTGDATVVQRYDPGVDGTSHGVIEHEFWEEVVLLSGELTDVTLGRTFTTGMYACRPPGMQHGPYRSGEGCTMFVTITYPRLSD